MRLTTALNHLPRLTTLLLACFLLWIHIRLFPYAFDDAYIHFRVARNFLETGFPYFNAGEMVKVSTSSGWTLIVTLLLGVARLVGVEDRFPLLISILNAIISVSGMLVFTTVMEYLLEVKARPLANMLFQLPFLALIVPSSIGLMETPLALLVAGLGIYCLLRSKAIGFALLGLAVNIRLELWLLAGLVGGVLILEKQFRFRHTVYFGMGCIPLLI